MEMPECSICLQPFDDEAHTPRSLSCGHSPCQNCLEELPRHFTDSSNANCVIRCPECNQWIKLPRQGISHLPKNIELVRFIDSFQQFQKGEVKPSPKTQNSHLQNVDIQPSKFHNSAPNSTNPAPKSNDSTPISNNIAPILNNLTSIINNKALNDRRLGSDWTNWIIPQEAIQLRNAEGRNDDDDDDGVILIGKLMGSSPFREQVVGLMPLGSDVATCPSPSSKGCVNSYSENITRAVESLVRAERQELKILMIHSLLNKKVCRLFGFWMSCEGLVYLVYEKLQRLKTFLIQSAVKSSDVDPISRRWLLDTSSKIVTEICEVVVRLHSQTLICGCLSPETFELDEFGHPLFSLSKALLVRRRLKDQIRNAVTGSQCSERKQIHNNMLATSSLMYLSPEVLSILYKNEQGCISDEIKGCNSDSISDRTTQINCKSDVWSLGCLLLMLLVGECPFDGLSFDELLRGIVIQKAKVDNWLDEKLLSKPLFSTEEGFPKNQIETFRHLLGKCFEYEPKNRPDAHDLWMCLSNWSTYREHPFKGTALNSSNQGCWCLFLGESSSTLATEIEFRAEKGTVDGRLQIHNRGNEFKDIHSNESRLIGKNGGKFSVNGGTELKMDELEVATLEGHLDCVTALAICGEFLLSASYDKTVHLWSLHTNSHVGTLRHEHRVLALAVNVEKSLCFSGDYGGCIFVWDIGSIPRQEPLMTWYDHKDWRYTGVHSLAISKDGYLYSGSGDRTVKAWSLQDYSLISTMEGHKSVVSALCINEGLLYSGSWDGTIRLWWLRDHSPLAVLGDNVPSPVSSVHALAMCNDTLVAVYNNGQIQIWKDDLLLKSIQVLETAILALDGKDDWIFTGGWDKTIKGLSIGEITEDPSPVVIHCTSVVTSLVFYHGKLVVGFADKVIKVRVPSLRGVRKYNDKSMKAFFYELSPCFMY